MIDRTTFDHYADRGTPLGAAALLERVETTLARPESAVAGRRWSGVAIAATAMIAVLLLGAVWALLSRPTDDAIEAPRDDTVEPPNSLGFNWEAIDGTDAEFVWDVEAGPGGFILTHSGDVPLLWSGDGVEWQEIAREGLVEHPLPEVVGGRTSWLVTDVPRGGHRGAWLSDDGLTWRQIALPEAMRGVVDGVYAAGEGFLALTLDVDGSGKRHWWSPDGETWTVIDQSGAPIPSNSPSIAPIASASAAVLCCERTSDSSARMWISEAGAPWTAMPMILSGDLVGDSAAWEFMSVERLNGRWVGLSKSLSETGLGGALEVGLWSVEEGSWVGPVTIPGLPSTFGNADAKIEQAGDSLVLVVRVFGSGTLAWISDNTADWTQIHVPDNLITSLFAVRNADLPSLGVYAIRADEADLGEIGDPDRDDGVVVTTTAPSPQAELIDPAGIEFQNIVLQDGVVTLHELEAAFLGWVACMKSRGFPADFDIGASGIMQREVSSPHQFITGETEDAACRASWVDQIESGPFGPDE